MSPRGSVAPIVDNAFLVLGLTPRASWSRVRQCAERLLLALETGQPHARRYQTPLGTRLRTESDVIRAMTRLRDPDERIQHEIWWEAPVRGDAPAESTEDAWPQAPAAWGWKVR